MSGLGSKMATEPIGSKMAARVPRDPDATFEARPSMASLPSCCPGSTAIFLPKPDMFSFII